MPETILITGGTGFLGRFLGNSLSRQGARVVLGARNNEQNRLAGADTGCETKPLDVVSIESVRDAINEVRPDIVIHAAATKYVDLSEKEPMECIDVNILGSQNIIRASIDAGVKQVLAISTDKAAPPVTTTYGITKALMERMFCSMHGNSKTEFATVRFGNIAWSTGSVFPLWKEMQERDNQIDSTGPHMRRYFFSIHDAVELVETALANFDLVAGRILTCDMGAAQIADILQIWTDTKGGVWRTVGERPGDSIDQGLVGESEVPHTRAIEIDDNKFYLIDFSDNKFGNIDGAMSSANARRLSAEELIALIQEPQI